MSVSRITLRFEISNDFPLLTHLHFYAKNVLTTMDESSIGNKDFGRNEKEKGNLQKELRGCRQMSTISVESITNEPAEDGSEMNLSYAEALQQQQQQEVKQKSEDDKETSLTHFSESSQPLYDTKNRGRGLGGPLQMPFYSGNHFIEVTTGILHLYKENQIIPLQEEVERSEMLCILAVPGAMTTHDLLQFTAPVGSNLENLRIIRNSKPNQYMVLLKFRNQKSADEFYENFNGLRFNSIEPEVCHLVYVAKVETVKESEETSLPLYGHTELPTCPVCLERMDESVEGILTILCNHSFHGLCLAKWGDTSCPVCRYSQTPELVSDNHCFSCGAKENLWICLICGHVGCGRYLEGHAFKHYLDTQHTYALQLGNNRVWDYVGDNYVHRLVQNKTDGKPVELVNRGEMEQEEKLDSIQLEYTYLLTGQLEAQRHFFEEQMARMEKEAHRQMEELKEMTKLTVEGRCQLEEKMERLMRDKQAQEKKICQLTSKLNKALLELSEEKEMNKCLRQNQQAWNDKLKETEKQLSDLKESKEQQIAELNEQVRDLMFYLEAQEKLKQIPQEERQEIQEGQILMDENTSSPSSQTTSTSSTSKARSQRRRKNR